MWTIIYQGPQFEGDGFWIGLGGTLASSAVLVSIFISRTRTANDAFSTVSRKEIALVYVFMIIFFIVLGGSIISYNQYVSLKRRYNFGNYATLIGCVQNLRELPLGDGGMSGFSVGHFVFNYYRSTSGFGYHGNQVQLKDNLRIRLKYMPDEPFPENRIIQIAISRPDCK